MSGGRGRAALGAFALWTAVAFGLLYFDPGSDALWEAFSQPPFTCGRLVGRGPACEIGLQSLNDTWNWLHIYPLLAFIVLGYVAITVIVIRGRRRKAS